jgi:hypothetical protein
MLLLVAVAVLVVQAMAAVWATVVSVQQVQLLERQLPTLAVAVDIRLVRNRQARAEVMVAAEP